MKRFFLMTMFVALATVMVPLRAAQSPVCPPQDFKQTLRLLSEDMTTEELMQFVVAGLNEGVQESDPTSSIVLDEKNKTVILHIILEDEELTPEDVNEMDDFITSMFKNQFLKNLITDPDVSPVMELIAASGYNFEYQIALPGSNETAMRFVYLPNEIKEALLDYENEAPSSDFSDGEGDVAEAEADDLEGLSEEEVFASLIEMMDQSLQEETGLDARIWIDDKTNAVVMSIVNEEFASLQELKEMGDLVKPLLLNSIMSDDDGSIGFLLGIISGAGRDFEMRYCSHHGEADPFVVRYTPKELDEAIGE